MATLSAERAVDTARVMGRGFGLDLDAGFDCPGLPAARPPVQRDRHVRLDVGALANVVDAPGTEELWRLDDAAGRLSVRLSHSPGAGYSFDGAAYGRFQIAEDGSSVQCAPVPGPAWRWQRFLIGQVLPLVALLHGYELFHASAVRWRGQTVAMSGPSRGGKSSIATALLLRGATLVSDDVLVVSGDGGDGPLHVEPAFGLVSVRHDAAARLGADAIASLGTIVGSDDDAIRVAVDVCPTPSPLAAMLFIERHDAHDGPHVERFEHTDPRRLLGAAYNQVIRAPERMTRHLDVCARIARGATVGRIVITPDLGPREVADEVIAHLET